MSDFQANKYGSLLNKDITMHRRWFDEMTRLIGINVIYKSPRCDKTYNEHGELVSSYNEPILLGCIFQEHPDQKTLKKMGWASELQSDSSIIHLPYNTPNIQVGALVIVPSGLDSAQGRVFRIIGMMNSIIYPSAITCEIAPEYENNFEKAQTSHIADNFNLLSEGD